MDMSEIESIVKREVEKELEKERNRTKEKLRLYKQSLRPILKEMTEINANNVINVATFIYFLFSGLICIIIAAFLGTAPDQNQNILDLSNLLKDPELIIKKIVAKEFIFPIIEVMRDLLFVVGIIMLLIALIYFIFVWYDNKKLAKTQEEMNEIETSFWMHD